MSDKIVLWVSFSIVALVVAVYVLNPLGAASRDPRLRVMGFTIYRMPSRSMEPTIAEGALFVVSAWPYARHAPRQGDVIVFHYPPDPDVDYVKRLIASGGEEVSISGCIATVNGIRLAEPYIGRVADPQADVCNVPPTRIPAGFLYVLGDARENSSDSRIWGFLPTANVVGKAVKIINR